MTQITGGEKTGKSVRVGVIASRFNSAIADALLKGCIETLRAGGVVEKDITVVRVPGAFEIPFVARRMAAQGDCDVLIALGAVIRGETPHFDYIAGQCARGVAEVSADLDVPVIFGVLTTETLPQAAARAGGEVGNKGADAARAAIEMVNVLRALTK
ncbi:MAG TPA: 6,7-dimethyl-8-ribityllumazine synthase [Gammaproteobacteria bacterium]|nr:6,7-dimethyl-8-ribityllumazine synthase [Gammaproteobacteria bacterium]